MDDVLPLIFLHACISCLFAICVTIVLAVVNYWLFLALLPFVMLTSYFARNYLKSSRELKRIEAIKCSPVYSHITETAKGLEIVHTSNMNRTFLDRLEKYVTFQGFHMKQKYLCHYFYFIELQHHSF